MQDQNEAEGVTEAGRQYAVAYALQYATKDLHEAFTLYRCVMAAYPDTPEADYSRMQIMNIATSVVPKQELLDAQVALTLAHFEHEKAT